MGNTFEERRRAILERSLSQLNEEYEAVQRQLGYTLEDADKLRLKRRSDRIESEIQELEKDILRRYPPTPTKAEPPGKTPPRETTTIPIAAPPKFVASRPDHESAATPEAQPANPRQLVLDLKEIFSTRFSLEEMKGFCLQLGIDYENLPHGSKSSLARELALYLERRSLFQEAISAGKVLRPDIEWDRLLAQ